MVERERVPPLAAPVPRPPSPVDEWAGVAPGSDLGVHAGTRSHLDVLLDSMLITHRVPAGVPFGERIGEVPDPRIPEVMRVVDDTLGGRIESLNVCVTDDLIDRGLLGVYRSFVGSDGETASPEAKARRAPEDQYGIHLSRAVVECEFTHGVPQSLSVRHLLVHELQHAISFDNSSALFDAGAAARCRTDTRRTRSLPSRAALVSRSWSWPRWISGRTSTVPVSTSLRLPTAARSSPCT